MQVLYKIFSLLDIVHLHQPYKFLLSTRSEKVSSGTPVLDSYIWCQKASSGPLQTDIGTCHPIYKYLCCDDLTSSYEMLLRKSSMARLASPWATATAAGITNVFALVLQSTAASDAEVSFTSIAPCSFSHVMHALRATGRLTCSTL